MIEVSFISAVLILLVVVDPFGNVPFFVSMLAKLQPLRRRRVVIRECAIATLVLLAAASVGKPILDVLGLSDRSLNIAGGVILFIIALRMIFRRPEGIFGETGGGEPFIVPLAIPSVAGPTAIATVMLQVSQAPHRLWEWLASIVAAMALCTLVLLFADTIGKWLGERGVMAMERLMGLLLTAVAVEMLLRGIEGFVRYLKLT
jgi:MarC family membrane protein